MLVSNVVRKPLLIRFFVVLERRAVSDVVDFYRDFSDSIIIFENHKVNQLFVKTF